MEKLTFLVVLGGEVWVYSGAILHYFTQFYEMRLLFYTFLRYFTLNLNSMISYLTKGSRDASRRLILGYFKKCWLVLSLLSVPGQVGTEPTVSCWVFKKETDEEVPYNALEGGLIRPLRAL